MATIALQGGERLRKKLAQLSRQLGTRKTVRAGFLEGATYADGTSVATVAALNNFGAPGAGIPPRPFMAQMIQRNSPEWGAIFMNILKNSGGDVDKALAKMGLLMAGQIADSIVAMNEPPNSMVTNLLKDRFPGGVYGFPDVVQAWRDVAAGESAPAGKPLVWSGHLLQSIGSEVVE